MPTRMRRGLVIPPLALRTKSRTLALSCRLRRAATRKLAFQPRDIVEQAAGDQLDEIKSEFRILEEELFDLAVADLQHISGLEALQRLCARALGCEQGKLADHMRRHNVDSAFRQ